MDDISGTMSADQLAVKEGNETVPWWTSCRLTIALMGLLGTTSTFSMGTIMSVAIVCMTTDNTTSSEENGNYSVPNQFAEMSLKLNATLYDGSAQGEFYWDRELRGWVLSSFYIGNILTQIPGGWLANRFGGKMIVEAAVGSMALLSLLTPAAARTSVYLLMVLQALKGAAEGLYFPAFFQILGEWAPPNERSVLATLAISSGASAGAVLSSILGGILCEYGFDGGWPSIFYVFGVFGAVWSLLWLVMGFSSPSEHPRISEVELKYLMSSINISSNKSLSIPWWDLLTSIPVHAVFVVSVCYSWVWFVALSCLPQFMKDVLDLDIKQNGLSNSLPYIAYTCLSLTGSVLADFLIKRNVMSTTAVRKFLQTIGMVPSAAIALGVTFLPKGMTVLAISLLALWVGILGLTCAAAPVNIIEIAPRYAGVLLGIDFVLCAIPAIIAPPIVGAITSLGSKAEWQKVLYACSAICAIGWLFYIIFADARLQRWAMVKDKKETSDKEMNSESTSRWGMDSKDIACQRSQDTLSEKYTDNLAFKSDTDDLRIYSSYRDRTIVESTTL